MYLTCIHKNQVSCHHTLQSAASHGSAVQMVNNYVRNCMENGFVYGVTLNRVERMDLAMSLNWMARLSQRFFMGIARDLGSTFQSK